LYFFVPRGNTTFVLGVVEGGDPYSRVQIRTSDGKLLCDQRLLAGDQLSVNLRDAARDSITSSGRNDAVDDRAMILALSLDSLRCVVEIYNIPPFVARHPSELLVPVDAL
jgi:hypothetical protein